MLVPGQGACSWHGNGNGKRQPHYTTAYPGKLHPQSIFHKLQGWAKHEQNHVNYQKDFIENDIYYQISKCRDEVELIIADNPKSCTQGRLLYLGFRCMHCKATVICEACNGQEMQRDLKEFFRMS